MSIELLAIVDRSTKDVPPQCRVRCTGCGEEYLTRQWPNALRKAKGCRSCGNRRRAKR